jgi:UDP-N-acetylmuramate--alanine ligase
MKKVFFIGINGIGMSGLAKIMKARGYEVSGSDIAKKDITVEMEKMGIKVYTNHDAKNLKGIDTVIYSSAIKGCNPEYCYAKANGLEIIKRGELLAKLMMDKKGIAVAGTHGKTTTSSMMGVAIMSKKPTIVVGGILPEINSNSKIGDSDFFVAEADESDNSFLYMRPYYSIITNIEEDHMDYHENYENLKKSFREFINNTKEKVLVSKDCEELCKLSKNEEKVIYYSVKDKSADIYAENIRRKNGKNCFDVVKNGEKLGEFCLGVPGEHNISNSLGVIYLATEFGVEKGLIQEGLASFKGAKRRFDILYENDITIVDDYAHHPTEIKATLKAAKETLKKRIIAIFQPHRYSRVRHLMTEFSEAFEDADQVIFLPIYSAGEDNVEGISSEMIAEKINGDKNINIINEENGLKELILKNYNTGDMYIFMGAGNISQMAYLIKDEYKKMLFSKSQNA